MQIGSEVEGGDRIDLWNCVKYLERDNIMGFRFTTYESCVFLKLNTLPEANKYQNA